MFTPDLLHEFELGVWKAFFLHMLRIFYAFGQDTIQELNLRYVDHDLLPNCLLTSFRLDIVKSHHSGEIRFVDSVITYRR
jgi:hypothetical protein